VPLPAASIIITTEADKEHRLQTQPIDGQGKAVHTQRQRETGEQVQHLTSRRAPSKDPPHAWARFCSSAAWYPINLLVKFSVSLGLLRTSLGKLTLPMSKPSGSFVIVLSSRATSLA